MHHRGKVQPDEALQRVQTALWPKVRDLKLNYGQVDCVTDPGNYVLVMTTLRDDPALGCKFFTFLSAVDRSEFGEDKNGLEVLVHVFSPEHLIHVNVHVPVEGETPVCPSISSIYAGATWHERETHEMFGIVFEGHPRLVNLYLPEDFEGHPLLKSFKLPSRLVKEWPGAKDPEEAAAGGRG
jgi:NADH-quinone oxidoreductase subunit C